MSQGDKLVILDFDGVMIDSVREVVLTAYNAATGEFATTFEETPSGYPEVFLRNRFLVQPAADFILFAHWCLEKGRHQPDTVLSEEEFQGILQRKAEPKEERRNAFFAARSRFLLERREAWLTLHSVYQPLWNELQRHPKRVIVLTNKNAEAVLELCEHFGLTLESENVYSAEKGATKVENFRKIQERFGFGSYLFVDDHIGNLHELRSAFSANTLELGLADWGYVQAGHEREAADCSYEVFSQRLLVQKLQELPFWTS